LGEIDCHSIKHLSRLHVSVHLLVAKSRDACCTFKKLCEKQNEHHEYADANYQFGQRKTAGAATLFQGEASRSVEARILLRARR